MKKTREFQVYTGIWVLAVLILFALLWQNVGDARIINYSGIVRGATQKLVKEELHNAPNDNLIAYLDGVIYDLQTGKGDYGLSRSSSKDYQRRLAELKLVWEDVKAEIRVVRRNDTDCETLFALSQKHFQMADQMVLCAEQYSDSKLARFTGGYFLCLVLSILAFAFVSHRGRKALRESIAVDSLTGLLCRAGFEAAAESRLRQNPKTEYVLIEFDIDNFKVINDVCGYAAGDQLLRGIAAAVWGWQGQAHLGARIDADDFVLLAERTGTLIPELQHQLELQVQRLDFLEPFGGVEFTFGAYRIPNNSELIKTAMDKANTARKTAKASENALVVWYDDQLREKLKRESRYKEQMHQAIAAREFQMYLQPQVDLHTLETIGAEALVRWRMPDGEMVYPDAFILLFEKNSSIAELDFYMLERACDYLRAQIDQGAKPFSISVNFSRVTLYRPMFYESFLGIVDSFSLEHSCINIEVTESAFNEVADSVLQMLANLHDAGFSISMDDFGAGYSNLSLLSRLPIQFIKLDREFLRGINRNDRIKGIITSVLELAHSMGAKVVCEGVERPEHVALLREIGCDQAQGYFIARPIPGDDYAGVVAALDWASEFPAAMSGV